MLGTGTRTFFRQQRRTARRMASVKTFGGGFTEYAESATTPKPRTKTLRLNGRRIKVTLNGGV